MGQQETTMSAATEERGGDTLKRLVLVLLVAGLMAALMALSAGPAQAKFNGHPVGPDPDTIGFSGGEGGPGGGGGGNATFELDPQDPTVIDSLKVSGGGGSRDDQDQRGGGTATIDFDTGDITNTHGSNPPLLKG
jgi:hypothetical protein